MVSEKFLYQRLSIGWCFPRRKTRGRGGRWEAPPVLNGREIVSFNDQLSISALVNRLVLGALNHSSSIKHGTHTSTLIIQICPSARHLEVRGFLHPSQLNTLTDALKQKSHVLSRISPHNIVCPDLQRLDFSEGAPLRFLELMKSWPNPQFVLLKGSRDLRCDSSRLISILPASEWRPDLQDVVFTVGGLSDLQLNAF